MTDAQAPGGGGKPMEQWVIYDHPTDFPNCFVARRWLVYDNGTFGPTFDTMLNRDLEGLQRLMVSMGLTKLSRFDTDDPAIVEVWL